MIDYSFLIIFYAFNEISLHHFSSAPFLPPPSLFLSLCSILYPCRTSIKWSSKVSRSMTFSPNSLFWNRIALRWVEPIEFYRNGRLAPSDSPQSVCNTIEDLRVRTRRKPKIDRAQMSVRSSFASATRSNVANRKPWMFYHEMERYPEWRSFPGPGWNATREPAWSSATINSRLTTRKDRSVAPILLVYGNSD